MGCPDWPKCFGKWIPPSSIAELPPDYKEIYAAYREKKNIRFAKYLSTFGLKETGERILNDPGVLRENDFNPTKTWIEYINRVIGVVIGFLIFAVFLVSWKFRKTVPRLTVVAAITLGLVAFQGWIGSFVVSTNLTPWTITVHMFLALVIVALLIYLVHQSSFEREINSSLGFWWLMACMAVLLVQILLGTQVREAIDQTAVSTIRAEWISHLGTEFLIHRSFSWIVLILHVGLMVRLYKTEGLKSFALTLILLILGTILTGLGMAYFAVPAFLQPLHLLLATVTFGTQFAILLRLNRRPEIVAVK
jgi:cytochrome c oxidase assembly protein subunit 15